MRILNGLVGMAAAARIVPDESAVAMAKHTTDEAHEKLNAALDKLRKDKSLFEHEAQVYRHEAEEERKQVKAIHV
jgi:ABC-type amino acid transport substrate-binding protein